MNKIKILSIIDSLSLRDGGPSHSLIDMALANKANDIQHDILYIGDKEKISINKEIKIISLEDSKFKYGFSIKLILWLLNHKNSYNLFIIHGIWQFITLISRMIIPNKYLVFTHGMLDPYFGKENFKTIKKKIYWNLFERKNLLMAKYVLLNSAKELTQLNKTFVNTIGIKYKLVNYGLFPRKIDFNKCEKKFSKKFNFINRKRFILFIGRIHPKKGCFLMVKAFAKIKNINNFKLLIAGDTNNLYAKEIKNFIIKKKLHDKVYFLNFLKDEIKWGAIRKAKYTILPSHGDNFGVSIVESLFAGTPVICSNKVGISDIIRQNNAGIIISDNINSIKLAIEKVVNINQKKSDLQSSNSIKCFNNNFNLKKNHSFSNWLKEIL